MQSLKRFVRIAAHWAAWLAGSTLTMLCLFNWQMAKAIAQGNAPFGALTQGMDYSVYAVAFAISFFGAFRTLGTFTFAQAAADMAENARNNPQAFDHSPTNIGPEMGMSINGEAGFKGSCDSKGSPIF